MAWRALGVAGAAATVALYFVTIGCWEILAEIFGGVDLVDVPSKGYSTAHVLHDIGNGAAHMGNFPATAYVGATAAAMLASTPSWRRLGWLGVAITALRLVSALDRARLDSHWSDDVSIVGFLAFLGWVFAASAMLVGRPGAMMILLSRRPSSNIRVDPAEFAGRSQQCPLIASRQLAVPVAKIVLCGRHVWFSSLSKA